MGVISKMTTAELEETLANELEISKKAAAGTLEVISNAIKETLENGDEFLIKGVGKLVVQQKAARNGRNPKTGEALKIPAKKVVKFKTATALSEALN